MLFNSYVFIFVFVPLTAGAYFLAARYGRSATTAHAVLAIASLIFYAYWRPPFILLIASSITLNYLCGIALMKRPRKWLLAAGVAINLGLIGYFKYAGFLAGSFNAFAGTYVDVGDIFLPLGISFFTFQQIAYLVDTYRGAGGERNPARYALFVSFFPQLIAGPIVHHGEVIPQFKERERARFNADNFAAGVSIFILGLFKKTVIADTFATWASGAFDGADALTFLEGWGATFSYTFQLYFDFSGYSDMAIGLGRMFNIRLPVNFNSPYKAACIIDFWRRWHMTLSRFLREYLYFPLGGNRKGKVRRYVNLSITMLLGGLWHGAGWSFVVWGALHGLYLMANHAWNATKIKMPKVLGWAITFLAVAFAWVIFRAPTLERAGEVYRAMLGANGFSLPVYWNDALWRLGRMGVRFAQLKHFGGMTEIAWLAGALIVTVAVPNSMQILEKHWKPNVRWAIPVALMAALSLAAMTRISEFLYFQF